MTEERTAGVGVTTDGGDLGDPADEATRSFAGRFELEEGTTLRRHTARGMIINSAFQVAMIVLNLVQRLAVAAFLTVAEFGFWGLIVTTLMTITWLKEVGIADKYIQQDEKDQVLAFQKAFTLELFYTAIFFVICIAALPVYSVIYDRSDIIVPGAILCLSLFGTVLTSPLWIFYRRMEFVKQRTLLATGPVVGTIVTVGMAVAGFGYWSLVIGNVAGTAVQAAFSMAFSPYPLAIRYDRGTLREYVSFSWPLFLNGLTGLIVVQGAIIVGNWTVGLIGLGAIGLATNFAQFVSKVDGVVKQTMYPAVCAVRERKELLLEAFVKSNRLAMMWGLPFGLSLALFGPDLVTYVLGEKWRVAEDLVQVFGVVLGVAQIAFNWTIFMRAIGNTWPIALSGILTVVVFLAVTMPLMITVGLTGYVIGVSVSAGVELAFRGYYMSRLFAGFRFWRHVARAVAPSVPAVGAVVLARIAEAGPRTLGMALAELALYAAVTAVATWLLERRLIGEVIGYLRRGGPPQGAEPLTTA